MLLRTVLLHCCSLLLGTGPAVAQPVPVRGLQPTIVIAAARTSALTFDVAYHCRSSQPLSFVPEASGRSPSSATSPGGGGSRR